MAKMKWKSSSSAIPMEPPKTSLRTIPSLHSLFLNRKLSRRKENKSTLKKPSTFCQAIVAWKSRKVQANLQRKRQMLKKITQVSQAIKNWRKRKYTSMQKEAVQSLKNCHSQISSKTAVQKSQMRRLNPASPMSPSSPYDMSINLTKSFFNFHFYLWTLLFLLKFFSFHPDTKKVQSSEVIVESRCEWGTWRSYFNQSHKMLILLGIKQVQFFLDDLARSLPHQSLSNLNPSKWTFEFQLGQKVLFVEVEKSAKVMIRSNLRSD